MKTALWFLGMTVLGAGLVTGAVGCELGACDDESEPAAADAGAGAEETTGSESDEDKEGCVQFESLKKFVGTSETKQVSWATGGKVRVDSRNGHVVVKAGSTADLVSVEFTPFSWRGHTKKDQAVAEIENKLEKVADGDGSGGAVIKTSRKSGATSGLGADVVVTLPSNFDGTLEIEQDNGSVEVQSVASAAAIDLTNTGAGDCEIDGGPTVKSTKVTCEFDIAVYNVADAVTIRSTGLGDVDVALASVAAGSGGGSITADKGSVNLTVPSADVFSVQATASGTVDMGTPPSGCQVTEAASNSKTLACGAGGPNYTVSAGADTAFEENVTVAYR